MKKTFRYKYDPILDIMFPDYDEEDDETNGVGGAIDND